MVWNMPQSALSLHLMMTHGAEEVQIDSQDAAGTIHIWNYLYNQVAIFKYVFSNEQKVISATSVLPYTYGKQRVVKSSLPFFSFHIVFCERWGSQKTILSARKQLVNNTAYPVCKDMCRLTPYLPLQQGKLEQPSPSHGGKLIFSAVSLALDCHFL